MLPTVQVVREHGEVKWGKQFTIYKSPPWKLTNVGRIITPPSISSITRYRSQTVPAGLIFPVAAGNMAQQCPATIPSTQQKQNNSSMVGVVSVVGIVPLTYPTYPVYLQNAIQHTTTIQPHQHTHLVQYIFNILHLFLHLLHTPHLQNLLVLHNSHRCLLSSLAYLFILSNPVSKCCCITLHPHCFSLALFGPLSSFL